MPQVRHLFPGGNTCCGFHSFYEHLAKPGVVRKFILKGGPGVGKSTLMKQIGRHFAEQGCDVEFHWCSSDADSLDGIVIGPHQVCFLDGTAPHVVDPRYPGAVDEIVNLGEYWHREAIAAERDTVIRLTQEISFCFERAYCRLQEAQWACRDWSAYLGRVRDPRSVSRNILALTSDFLHGAIAAAEWPDIRRLFPGAITPDGIVVKANHILPENTILFAVKGSPGSGVKQLLAHIVAMIELNGFRAEIFHNPLDPALVDIILLPDMNRAIVDVGDPLFEYSTQLSGVRYRRQLDFDQLIPAGALDAYAKRIALARDRCETGVAEAVEWIAQAKQIHDHLEQVYIPAMDFSSIDRLRSRLIEETAGLL